MSTVTASDGVTLAVHAYTGIDPSRPTILAIHGWPDNHHVWDALADRLIENYPGCYNVVGYDVRGAGESSAPACRAGYRFPQLVADVDAVIEHLGVDRVHLLGHDWGSIQGWAAVTDARVSAKIASYTSISGPHLDYAGAFLRSPRSPRAVFDVVRQLFGSGYIWFFLTPRLPEALFGSRAGRRLVEVLGGIGGPGAREAPPRSVGDYRNGLNLYRANMPRPFLAPAKPLPQTSVPAQTLIPGSDVFVGPALQRFTGSIPGESRVVPIPGGHWGLADYPDLIVKLTAEWVDRTAGDRRG